ncbi:PP2C family protein-serine/threonine phosphatase [Gracilibacillus massiliensis]|uniref:PP2C family protein-serine/threonine phosphatase n=1 Tax=Gracilibacillus massiliensis TaxID=1564956 RepID=UPI0011DE21D9|nr:PP2C family serine/threonine-protein phosphatase [Gracilibacillus massiliensis]
MTTYYTEKGTMKQINQDALMIKTAQTNQGTVGLFVVCDGMGGLGKGEVASTMIIEGLSEWFQETLPNLLQSYSFDEIPVHFVNKIEYLNEQLIDYGTLNQIKCGTTLTAILVREQQFFTFQVGDSRAYSIGQELNQLTKDQSVVARELERGTITMEQATTHPERHVLLQCIGIEPVIEVATTSGVLTENEMILLCTDGFYHRLTDQEMLQDLQPSLLKTKEAMQNTLASIVNTIQNRQETDDITSILIKLK